jgi:transcriptional regulator with XRE-family HTH domain
VSGVGNHGHNTVAQLLDNAREDSGHRHWKDVAEKVGVDPRTLRRWLRDPSKITAERVEQLAAVLKMSPTRRAALHALTGHVVPTEPNAGLRTSNLMRTYARYINGSSHPSCVHDHLFDTFLMNRPYRDLFAGVPRCADPTAMPLHNGLRYIFFHPQAWQLLGRDHDLFRNHWLMPALANFSAVLLQRPNDPYLQRIEAEILANSTVARAYRDTPAWIDRTGDLYVNADERPFWDVANNRLTHVSVITEVHEGTQFQFRHITFVFTK